jgi:hypothetical protein
MLALGEYSIESLFRPRTIIDPDGTVEGSASLFDQAHDILKPGANGP